MKVTPVSRKFGKYAPGDVFELKDKTAKLLIKVGKLREPNERAIAVPSYQTRMMQAEEPARSYVAVMKEEAEEAPEAPYGYKADGTPRLRPGRPAKASDE